MGAAPFLSLSPQRLSPLVLTCEHASSRIPPGLLRDRPSQQILATHWGVDLGAWELAAGLARRLEASAVGARWSRLVIDVNRPAGDPTLIRREAGGVILPWNHALPASEFERRWTEYHVPYHAEIDRLAVRRLVRGIPPLLLAVHTFTPQLGRSRRGFDVGVLYVDEKSLARQLAGGLREQGLSVRYNQPYSGLLGFMYATDRHGSHHGVPSLEIEINQERLTSRRAAGRTVAAVALALGPVLRAARKRADTR